jgi:hypothetical protein
MLLWRLFQGHDRERYYKYFEVQQASGSSLPMLSQKRQQLPQAWQ